jgi:hypothetical protein
MKKILFLLVVKFEKFVYFFKFDNVKAYSCEGEVTKI